MRRVAQFRTKRLQTAISCLTKTLLETLKTSLELYGLFRAISLTLRGHYVSIEYEQTTFLTHAICVTF